MALVYSPMAAPQQGLYSPIKERPFFFNQGTNMQINTRRVWMGAMSAVVLAGLVACGGSSGPTPITKVYVMGDSLADVGTFGLKFTVQDASSSKGFPIWTQIVANNVGVDGAAQCSFYRLTPGSAVPVLSPQCTNFAIGGGRIVVSAADGGTASPLTVGTQLKTRAQQGNYSANDLLLIDGGGNDAADLVGAYLGAASGAQGLANYQAFLAQQLEPAAIASLLPMPNGAALAAGAYMQKLADTFYGQIKTQVLDKGATRVAVLNMPDITLTPRFSMVLADVTQKTDAARAQALQGAIRQWIGAFNAKLQANIGNDPRIAMVDFYADFADQVQNPASFALSNATDASCPVTGVGNDGLPSYTFPTCTSAALDTLPGKTAGWWKSYAFSDGFHPTPLGHGLLAASVSRALARAGWL
jgi:phospholipase/lecithinase/hemolysin